MQICSKTVSGTFDAERDDSFQTIEMEESETEFKIYVHVPQYNLADGQFKAFSLSSLPFELADKTFGRIQPEKTILIHNSDENLFVEMNGFQNGYESQIESI